MLIERAVGAIIIAITAGFTAGCTRTVTSPTGVTQIPTRGVSSETLHVFTWYGYSGATLGAEDRERAEYVFDGAPLGRGEAAFQAVLSQFKRLERGSTLIIVYFNPRPLNDGSSPYYEPFAPHVEEMMGITRDLGIRVIIK